MKDESELTFILEEADNAEVYILKGTDRETASNEIEQGDKLYPGNPLRITHNDDFLILFKTSVTGSGIVSNTNANTFTSQKGSFKLTYEVTGQ